MQDDDNFNNINNSVDNSVNSAATPNEINNIINNQEPVVSEEIVNNNYTTPTINEPVINNTYVNPTTTRASQPTYHTVNTNNQVVNNVVSKKTYNRLPILLGLIVLIVVGFLCYFFIFKKSGSNNKDGKVASLNKETKNQIMYFLGDYSLDTLGGMYNDGVKIFDKVDDNTLSLAIDYATNLGDDKDFILKEKIHDYFKEAFNIDVKEYPDLKCSEDKEILYYYSKEANVYRQNFLHQEHPEKMNKRMLDYYITDSFKKNDIYYVDVLFLYGNDTDGYFINGNKMEIDPDLYAPIEGEEYFTFIQGHFRVHIDEYIKANPIYEFGLKKTKDNKFYLYSLETIKKGDVENGQ